MSLEVWNTIEQTRAAVAAARASRLSVGLVPTMGALHEGHAALIREAAQRTGFVVVSVFVNPTQFGPNEDFDRYPRSLEADCELAESAGAAGVFAPTVAELYPRGGLSTAVDVLGLSECLEGPIRPGHFRGVATIVLKLLHIVSPDVAVFGEKDYQQLQIVRRMVADLDLAVEIAAVATVREPDGLALSSRNRYLSPSQRVDARALWRALEAAIRSVRAGQTSATRVRQTMLESLESVPGLELDYAAIVDAETLSPVEHLDRGRPARALVAARIGSTRLIDNAPLPLPTGSD
ncbi:MAG: pantothenate synthetase [Isosphaeraceae bacterium]|jgi:pantoate--beta-alanine ligase|nr:MAG: pantothenate synthetase [Isosphaeraceae bacterium]